MLHIVNCIGELCISMRRTSYFSNYVPLYLQSGHLLIRYDLLTLKICAILMDRMGDCMAFANAIMRHYEYSRTVIVKEA